MIELGGGFFGLLLLILDVYAIVRTLQSPASTGQKVFWVVFILVFQVVGLIFWFLLGPRDR